MPDPSQDELKLRRFREYVTAIFAAIFIITTIVMIIIAFVNSPNAEASARMKDLLLIILPYTGVILGYYFNRVTSEARAENAENVARNVMSSAQTAVEERQQAVDEAKAASLEAGKWRSSLAELYPLSKQMVSELGTEPRALEGVSSIAESTPSHAEEMQQTRIALELALDRARKILEAD